MTSKTKKILALGLSLSLMMPASLSRRVCAAQGSETDTGCSRALVDDINDPCMVANAKCSLVCFGALNGIVDTMPAFCGELNPGETPSVFLGCNEKFQKCMDGSLSFWEKWKESNSFWMENYFTFHFLMTAAGGVAIQVLGGMFAGIPGAILSIPLVIGYNWLFTVE